MEDLQLNVEDAENRAEWRRRTRVADPSPEGSTAWRRERETKIASVHQEQSQIFVHIMSRFRTALNTWLQHNASKFMMIILNGSKIVVLANTQT